MRSKEEIADAMLHFYEPEGIFTDLTKEVLKPILVECLGYKHCAEGRHAFIEKCENLWEVDNDAEDKLYEETGDYSETYHKKYGVILYLHDHFDFKYYWVKANGTLRKLDEACEIVADEWCKLLFDWQLKDNGNLEEHHSFYMAAFSSVMGNKAKEKISEETKKKCHEIIKKSYKAALEYDQGWIKKNLDKDEMSNKYFKDGHFLDQNWISTDYDPSTSLCIILKAGGLDLETIKVIAPWKTHITIDESDYSVAISQANKAKYI